MMVVRDRPDIENLNLMKNLSHRLCVAPMMDRNDSFSLSIGCAAACAQCVHEGTAIDFACVRRNAIFSRRVQNSDKKERLR
jgi:hypothetical protein